MDYISLSDIRSFIDPRAFAVSRSDASGRVSLTSQKEKITTANAKGTLSLLLAAEQRLTDLRTSLQTMLDLSIDGAKSRSDRDYDEAYGKLRSLSAGFDQVIEASRYDGVSLFGGSQWDLKANGQPVDLEGIDLRAAGENLGLVERTDGARITIGYDAGTIIRNSYSGVVGLDIADATGIERTDGRPELDSGKYRLEIEYNGPESRIFLSDEYGIQIEELTGIDLTGSGIDLVKFKAGIQISLEKLQKTIGYDKWDYENEGPVSLFADLNYERVSWHTLAGDTNIANASAKAEWTYKPRKDYNEPALNLDKIEIAGVSDGAQELAEGNYSVKIRYRSEGSIVEIRDLNGGMVQRLDNVELGPDSGTYSINTGRGVKFTVENDNWTEDKTINATFNYTSAPAANRDFDFLAYGERLVDAISVIDEQAVSVGESIDRIQQQNQWAQGNAGATSSITSLLGGGSGPAGLLSGAGVSARINVSGMQLFSSINGAVSSQGAGATNILSFLA